MCPLTPAGNSQTVDGNGLNIRVLRLAVHSDAGNRQLTQADGRIRQLPGVLRHNIDGGQRYGAVVDGIGDKVLPVQFVVGLGVEGAVFEFKLHPGLGETPYGVQADVGQ